MLLDQHSQIKDLNGAPLKKPDGAEFLLVDALHEVLQATFSDEATLPAATKVERFELAIRLTKPNPVEVTIDEAAELKRLIGKGYGPLIVGRVYEIIEAAGRPSAEK